MKRVAIALWCLAATSSIVTGEPALEMVSRCSESFASPQLEGQYVTVKHTEATGWCWGAFEVLQKIIVFTDDGKMPLLHVCAPTTSTRVQLIKIFLAYANQHPEKLHQEFTRVAVNSLKAAFPCK
jgi:hypothetical protein